MGGGLEANKTLYLLNNKFSSLFEMSKKLFLVFVVDVVVVVVAAVATFWESERDEI